MAYALGTANFPGLSEFVHSGLTPRIDHDSRNPILNARVDNITTNTATGPTVNVFIDALHDNYEYAASIVSACVQTTVYALQCTKGPVVESSLLDSLGLATLVACGPNALIATMTVGPSNYAISTAIATSTLGKDVTGNLGETCKLAGTTAATCTATGGVTVGPISTTVSAVETLSGLRYNRFDVMITAGAEKISNPTACAKPTGGAGSLNPRNMAVWALAGAIGVANFLAL